MSILSQEARSPGKWLVLFAACLSFFFLNLATFQSLGVVLFSMVQELHWSFKAMGASFTFLGLACGLTSPLPGMLMQSLGSRITMCIGAVLLTAGFYLASVSSTLIVFYIAMLLMGAGYSFAGNVPSVYLITGWFGKMSARTIGVYLMVGALGAAIGPRLVRGIVTAVGGWRGNWEVMAVSAAAIGVVCLFCVRDAGSAPAAKALRGQHEAGGQVPEWSPRDAMRTSQFMLIAASMTANMLCVTTNASVALNHLGKLNVTPDAAAFILSAVGLVATIVKALAGRMCESFRPSHITAWGILLQAVGMLAFAFAGTLTMQAVAVIAFGTGWGLSYVAGTVVLLDYFGHVTGSKILSFVWFFVSFAAVGPIAAGAIADNYGTFAPIFLIYTVLLIILAIPIFAMRAPANPALPERETATRADFAKAKTA
jgi:MFS family permease